MYEVDEDFSETRN